MPQASASVLARPFAREATRAPGLRLARLRTRPELLLAPLALAVLLLLWEGAVWMGLINAFVVPPPSIILGSLFEGLSSGEFLSHGLVTAYQALVGFLIAVGAGIAIGALITEFRPVERVLYPYLVAMQTMPKIAVAPLIIVWFGFGMSSKIVVAAVLAFFPVLVNVVAGLKSADPGRLDVLRALGANRWRVFLHVKLPGALPFLFSGINVAVIFSLTGTIVGEFVSANAGLGYLIIQANSRMDIPKVFAILVVLGVIGVLAYSTVQAVRRRLLFWAPDQELSRT